MRANLLARATVARRAGLRCRKSSNHAPPGAFFDRLPTRCTAAPATSSRRRYPGQLRAAGDRQIGKRAVASRRHVTTAAILPLPSSAALPPPTGLATPRWPWKAGRRHRRGDPTLAALSRTETGSAHTGPCETARCCTAARLENFTIVVVVCHASLLWSVLRIHLVPPMNSVTAAATGSGCSTITKCPARGISTTCTRSPNCLRSACPFPGGATTSSRPWITRSGALPPVHHSSRGTPWLVAKCAM